MVTVDWAPDAPCALAGGPNASVICPNNNCSGIQAFLGPGGTTVIQEWIPPQLSDPNAKTIRLDIGYWETIATLSDSGGGSWFTFWNSDASDNGNTSGNSSGSTTWLQTKVFFQALGRNFIDEFKEGGCVNAFAQAFNEGGSSHLIPDLPAGSGVDDAIRTGAQAAATTYAINQGLTVPLRSSIYRGILARGEAAATGFVAVDFFTRAVEGAVAEGTALRNGTCH